MNVTGSSNLLATVGRPELLTPLCDPQLYGHWINLDGDRRILVANIKYMAAGEEIYFPHPCCIPGLHQTVESINDSDSTRWQWLSMTKMGPQSYIRSFT